MRRAANVDACQAEIVTNLRKCGVTVLHLHALGSGIPDLLCGYRGVNALLEVKDPRAQQKRSPGVFNGNPATRKAQSAWHQTWAGQVATVTSFDEAMEAILEVVREKEKL